MDVKKLFVFSGLFITQFLISCFDPFNECGDVTFFESELLEVNVEALTTIGNPDEVEVDTFIKNYFGFDEFIRDRTTRLAFTPISGLSIAYARDCAPVEYESVDPVDSIRIYLKDLSNGEYIDATDWFKEDKSKRETIFEENLNETRFKTIRKRYDALYLDSIPNSIKLSINYFLQSGNILSDTTEAIYFYD